MKRSFGVILLSLLLLITVVDSGSYVSVDTEKTPVAYLISDDVGIDATLIESITNPESFNYQTYSNTMEIPLQGLLIVPNIPDLELNELILTSTSDYSTATVEQSHQPEGLFRFNQGKDNAVNLV